VTAADAPTRARGSSLRELPFLVALALVIALLVKTFLLQAFYFPSASMERTLHGCPGCRGDRVLVNKVVYDLRGVHRGEIVVFDVRGTDFQRDAPVEAPASPVRSVVDRLTGVLGLGARGQQDFIKRVIALPGDRVACCSNGHVTVQAAGSGTPVELLEPYVFEDNQSPFCASDPRQGVGCGPGSPGVLVPTGGLWVMGDHRNDSADSRVHGPVPREKVVGRAFAVVWPPARVKGLNVPALTQR